MTREEIEDRFSAFGPVTTRKMFGGTGIYRDGIIFALEAYGEILLKADAQSAPEFEAAGSRQWVYQGKDGRQTRMPYWSIPDEAADDPEELALWAGKAYEAARRAGK